MSLHLGCSSLVALLLIFGPNGVAQPPQVNKEAALMADFTARVEKYVQLRDRLQKDTPRLQKKSEPAEITAAEKALAAQIRAARAGVKRGDIFTPAISAKFRRLLNPELKGPDGPETKAAIMDDNPGKFPFQINGEYPPAETLSTMPPNILASLPPLPKGKDLEYRFVGKHLILRDVRANIIIDFVPNAMP